METYDSGTRERRRVVSAEQNRRAMHVVRPFVARFEDWNHRAARASATMVSHVTSPVEKSQQQSVLADLLAEVDEAFDEFKVAIADEPSHGRVDDVRASFERLLSILRKYGA